MKGAFAVATVVGRTPPVSSHLGDRAVIGADGRMEGFIGGACSRDIIRRQALQAIRAGEPRIVRIRPDAREKLEDRDEVTVPMSCSSEGAVDVYIEPHVPKRALFLAGFTPVAQALAEMAPALDYEVVRFVEESEVCDISTSEATAFTLASLEQHLQSIEPELLERSAAIAASQGHYDELALAAFLKHRIGFVGLLASPKRAAAVAGVLAQEGISSERIAAIHNPVGLAIGARKPAEVAVSILAGIIAGRSAARTAALDVASETARAVAIDPVCGMAVEIPQAVYHSEFDGRTYYFCCAHCRASFAPS